MAMDTAIQLLLPNAIVIIALFVKHLLDNAARAAMKGRIEEIHLTMNSRLDQFLALQFAAGEAAERLRQVAAAIVTKTNGNNVNKEDK